MKHILLAEDNRNDVELTLSALEASNLANRVVVVRDGVEALDYLHCRGSYLGRGDGNPAVMLLDIKMPRVDGLQVLREIRGADRLKMIPVVLLTSSREDRDLTLGYELGANAYVVKPVDHEQFFEAIQKLGLFWAVINEPPPFEG